MIPYTDFAYFGLVAVFALPALIARALGRDARLWILAACAVMLAVQFVGERQQLISLGIFAAVQVLTIFGFQRICRMTPTRDRRRWAFYAAIAIVLLPLVLCRVLPYFEKHFTFGFLGLSYVTFRSLDVIFGLNDGLIASVEGPQLLAFLFFFPTISSGPIDRYRRFGKDWAATADRAAVLPDIDGVVQHLFRGLFYKFIVAWAVKQYWLDRAEAAPGALAMVSYMYAYSAFLFFDFAGYSAFAVGAGMLFGIRTPENFNRPFLAPNIRDFWTRWHISLSTWFRDHVYMRFVITAARGKWFRDSHIASHVGYILTFGLMGLWHGFAVNFLIYGLYHALLLIGYDIFKRWNQKRRLLGDGPFAKTFSTLATAQAVCFGFLIFSGHLNLGPTTAHPKVKAGLHASAPAPAQQSMADLFPELSLHEFLDRARRGDVRLLELRGRDVHAQALAKSHDQIHDAERVEQAELANLEVRRGGNFPGPGDREQHFGDNGMNALRRCLDHGRET